MAVILGFLFKRISAGGKLQFEKALFILLFSLWGTFSIFYSLSPQDSLSVLPTLSLNCGLFIVVLNFSALERKRLTRDLCVACSLILAYYASFLIGEGFFLRSGRWSIDSNTNPNQLGIGVIQILPFALFAGNILSNRLLKIGCLCAAVSGVIMILLRGSRTSLVALLFMFLISLVYFFTKRFNKKDSIVVILEKRLLYFTLIGVACFFLAQILPEAYQSRWADRLDWQMILHTNWSSRLLLWETSLVNVVQNNLLLGVGIGEAEAIAMKWKPSHNMVLSLVGQVGIIGLFLFGTVVFKAIRGWMKTTSEDLLYSYPYFVCLMASLVLGIAETVFMTKALWIAMAFCTAKTEVKSEIS